MICHRHTIYTVLLPVDQMISEAEACDLIWSKVATCAHKRQRHSKKIILSSESGMHPPTRCCRI